MLAVETIEKLFVEAGLITSKQCQQASEAAKKDGGHIETVLIAQGFISEENLLTILSRYYRTPVINLENMQVDENICKIVPVEVVQKYKLIPFKRMGSRLKVAMLEPSNITAIDDIKFMTGFEIEPYITSEKQIIAAINKFYDSEHSLQTVLKTIEDEQELDLYQESQEDISEGQMKQDIEEAPVVKLVNLILAEGIKKGVSDIHIEPYEKKFRVRYRLDGKLKEVMSPPIRLKNALTSRLKIMAELDISERRVPQDGRIKLKLKGREVDLRVSTLPTLFGEKIVMRILDKGNLMLDLQKLGFCVEDQDKFMKAIGSPWGMLLVTGPTGSGKTTTLYSALQHVNKEDVNIMTAEDPVEYNMLGINQVQMKEEVGLTFAAALRSFLRQDPDVIMVGEIRDKETAEIGIKAALTGHFVLSTLHTNDAPATINRLLNMGVEPFLVSSSVVLILAQRLVRKLCVNCKYPADPPVKALIDAGMKEEEIKDVKYYATKGCDVCSNTGYKGRIALYEVMPIDEDIRKLILDGASTDKIKTAAIKNGMNTLRMSGLKKVRDGITSLEEVTSATVDD